MTATQKAKLVIEQFPTVGWILIENELYHLEVDFKDRSSWLSKEEEQLLRRLEAQNLFAQSYDLKTKSWNWTNNLNTACCGKGSFIFEDDFYGGHVTDNSNIINQGNDSNLPIANR